MTKQVAAVAVKAVVVVVTMAAPITAMTFVVVTAGHTASLSTRVNLYGGCEKRHILHNYRMYRI